MSQQNVRQEHHEPEILAAGDTISFYRYLKDYPASQGWFIKYELRGGAVPIEFDSSQNAPEGDAHVILVASAVTATWAPADYVLAGFAELAGPPVQRKNFYLNACKVTPNFETAAGDLNVTTHAQRMLSMIESVLEGKASDDILDSEVEGTVIRRMPFRDLQELRAKYKRERQGELALERARAGRPTGRLIRPRLNVMFPGRVRGIGEFTGAETQDLVP